MQIGKKRTFFNVDSGNGFLDPDKCKNYIKHSSSGDTAVIRLTTLAENKGGPWSLQFILKPLSDVSSDKKVFGGSCVSGATAYWNGIYNGYWRLYNFVTSTDKSSYRSFGHYDLGLKVTTNKMNFEADAKNGIVRVNGQNFRDVSDKKSSLPDTTYYWMNESALTHSAGLENQVINSLDMMGMVSHDWGNLYYNFYAFRLWDKTGKLFCDLEPYVQNGKVGIYDRCTKLFWQKTHNSGSFVFGTDA